ncbi:hypothetical protein EAG_08064, partial [Camponotus floridanus]
RDAECHKCSKKGHIARVCRSNLDEPKPADKIKNSVMQVQTLSAIGKNRRQYVTTSILGETVILQYTSSDTTII